MTPAAALEARVIPIDPKDRSTWRNTPCPVDLSAIQQEMTRVGGVNEYGQPNFIIVWAQDYRTWDCGKMRIHFDEEAVDAIHTPNRFGVTPDVYSRCVNWYNEQHKLRSAAYMALDWEGFNSFPDIGQYLKENELSANYMRLPSEQDDLNALIGLMPAGWMYVNGLHTFEHIGQQCFYVLQWFRPQEFGSPDSWHELRFGKAYYPETDQDEPLIDILGPFPEHGQYEGVPIRICETRTYEAKDTVIINKTITREIHGYKTPTIENVIPPLQELLRLRDSLTAHEKDSVERNRKRFKDFQDAEPVNREKQKKRFGEIFNDAKPVGKGNPTNISANKAKGAN